MDYSGFDDTSAASERGALSPPLAGTAASGQTPAHRSTTRSQQLRARLNQTLPDAELQLVPFDLAQPLSLFLINADYQTGPLAPEVMHAVIADPAYWAFCWGSGLATAALILEQPALVAGRRVVDFGCGSGVVAIAAALAGASAVVAVDIDPDARLATAVNAEQNGVELEIRHGLDETAGHAGNARAFESTGDLTGDLTTDLTTDLTIVADVLYDRSNLPLLRHLRRLSRSLLIADSRLTDLNQHLPADLQATPLGFREAVTQPNLGEFDEFRRVAFFGYNCELRC